MCKRVCGKLYSTPDPPPLPKLRTQFVPPFTITKVNFTGALYVRTKTGEERLTFVYSPAPTPEPFI